MFLVYLIFPIVEIYILFQLGDELGFWPVFGWVLLTAWLGLQLLRETGFKAFAEFQQGRQDPSQLPQQAMETLTRIIGALLFLLPGVMSDFLGVLCFFPPTRRILAARLGAKVARGVRNGRVRVFSGFPGAGFPSNGPQGPFEGPFDGPRTMKDVTPTTRALDGESN